MRSPHTFAASLTLALAALGLSACDNPAPQQPAASDGPADAKPGLSVNDARLVLPAVSGNPAAAYFALANGSDAATALVAVAIDGAGKTEIHETVGTTMQPKARVDLAAGGTAAFVPGGLHVMAFDLDPRLQPGGSTEMTLTFADGDKLSTPIRIESRAAAAGADHGGSH